MTTPATSFGRSKTRSFGLATVLVLMGAMAAPFPGCLDDSGSNPPGAECTDEGQIQNALPTDCKQSVCRSGKLVEEAADGEIPIDTNPCTDDKCAGGVASNPVVADGSSCTFGGKPGTCTAGTCEVSCMVMSDCNDDNPCTTDTCGGNKKCSFAPDDALTPPDDGNPCTDSVCSGGVASHPNSMKDAPCGAMGKCDGKGSCAGCTVDADCGADTECSDKFCEVSSGKCQATANPDGELADSQAGDCKVPACSGGMLVMQPKDGDVAPDTNACVTEGCNNGTPTLTPIGAGTACVHPMNPIGMGVCDAAGTCLQCTGTNHCGNGFTCAMNTCFSCTDGTKNGTETDQDCGGECNTRCADGLMCDVAADCNTNCEGGKCVSCFDTEKNQGEGDINCGGPCTAKCNFNQSCNVGTDCFDGVCVLNKCIAPTCFDTVKNGSETDQDCGGNCLKKCVAGQGCKVKADCEGSLNCNGGICGT
jgi:hypothetical protein